MTLETPKKQSQLQVGILASGPHPVQTIYLPALHALSNLFTITAICTPQSPSNSITDILTNDQISLVLNFMPNEYHELYTIAALQAGKHVMVETPVSLSIPSAKRILDAEREAPRGARVFVASARRYAPCFENVFKKEVRGLKRIHYARLRMIAGPHVAHSATSSESNTNSGGECDGTGERDNDRTSRLKDLMAEIFGQDEEPNHERIALSRFLASLGCHDLGLMRDTLGYPDATSNISVNEPFYSALFHYNGNGSGSSNGDVTGNGSSAHHAPQPFTLMYETGTDNVPRCDAQLAVYEQNKTVTIHYDLPYARAHPVRVVVEAADERGGLKQTETVSTWEEAYQEELKALHGYLVEGKEAKTTARDSLEDIRLFQTIFKQYDRQCGTIRTPLG